MRLLRVLSFLIACGIFCLLTACGGAGGSSNALLGPPDTPSPGPLPLFEVQNRQIIEGDGAYNSVPAVVEAQNGDWVLSYRKGTVNASAPFVILRRSSDQGNTWSAEVQAYNTSGPDPTLARTPGGDLILEFEKKDSNNILGAAYTRSIDNGLTWAPMTFYGNPPNIVKAFPTQFLNDGSDIYAASYVQTPDTTFTTSLWISTDDGFTWSKRSDIRQPGESGMNETAIAQTGSSQLFAISRDDLQAKTFGHFSEDLGVSWDPVSDYTSQVGVLQLPQLLQVRSALLLFGRDFTNQALVVFASFDGGKTFGNRMVLDTYTGVQIDGGYSWPIVMPDGRVFVVYYADSNNLRKPDIKSLVLQVNAP